MNPPSYLYTIIIMSTITIIVATVIITTIVIIITIVKIMACYYVAYCRLHDPVPEFRLCKLRVDGITVLGIHEFILCGFLLVTRPCPIRLLILPVRIPIGTKSTNLTNALVRISACSGC